MVSVELAVVGIGRRCHFLVASMAVSRSRVGSGRLASPTAVAERRRVRTVLAGAGCGRTCRDGFFAKLVFFAESDFFFDFFCLWFFFLDSERVGISWGMLGLGPLRLGSFRSFPFGFF